MRRRKEAPIVSQYRRMKQQYPDFLLLFRLGDFYELFGEDARRAAEALDLTLTSRELQKGYRVPMCGFPHHSASRYIERLLRAGFKVAICEQVAKPEKAGQLHERAIVEVLTPGAILREEFLNEGEPNFLCGIVASDTRAGIAFLDPSTGQFRGTEVPLGPGSEDLLEELRTHAPRQILFSGNPLLLEQLRSLDFRAESCEAPATEQALGLCGEQLQAPPEAFGLTDHPLLARAAAMVLEYLRHLKLQELPHVRHLEVYRRERYLLLDQTAREHLELFPSAEHPHALLDVLNYTVTPMGLRRLRREMLAPLREREEIEARYDALEELLGRYPVRRDLREALRKIGDLERLLSRLAAGKARKVDLFRLRRALRGLQEVRPLMQRFRAPLLQELGARLRNPHPLLQLLEKALVEEPSEEHPFREGYDEELDRLGRLLRDQEGYLRQLEEEERQRSGIRSLRIGRHRVLGYYFEVPRSQEDRVPPDYEPRQKLTQVTRFTSDRLRRLEQELQTAEQRFLEREEELLSGLLSWVGQQAPAFQEAAQALALLDFLLSLAEASERGGYVRPTLRQEPALRIRRGRHPVLEQVLPPGEFIPNDLSLTPSGPHFAIITGPNMGGKSTCLRQGALIVLMAQMGCFVPAEEAEIGLVDAIFARCGLRDRIVRGFSTFMLEMVETARILRGASSRSLVLLDEIGRGTSTFDGISVAWAVAEYILRFLRCRTLFATHYHELTAIGERFPGAVNLTTAVEKRDGSVCFLYRIVPGKAEQSYGLEVARRAGLPEWVLLRAREVMEQLEAGQRRPEQKAAQRKLFS